MSRNNGLGAFLNLIEQNELIRSGSTVQQSFKYIYSYMHTFNAYYDLLQLAVAVAGAGVAVAMAGA